MPARKHKPEEIIGKLREVEIVLGQGGTTAEACRRIAVSEQTYYRWRKEYGGLKTDQARRMKDLEKENLRLRRAIRSEEHTSELQSLMRISYAVFCLKKKNTYSNMRYIPIQSIGDVLKTKNNNNTTYKT